MHPDWNASTIPGVYWRVLHIHTDPRGSLAEIFRSDELPQDLHPLMAYLSWTLPGVTRGPHEHREQTDYFCFPGPGLFRIYLWDARAHSASYGLQETLELGASRPGMVIVPPGVVHAYRNIASEPGLVVNCPNRLYRGPGRNQPVDEIRHENNPASPYRLE
ncbi:MAG: dTDP-4-dehydrorhamnose 3,5-epimerase [Gemmataceae bacterium]